MTLHLTHVRALRSHLGLRLCTWGRIQFNGNGKMVLCIGVLGRLFVKMKMRCCRVGCRVVMRICDINEGREIYFLTPPEERRRMSRRAALARWRPRRSTEEDDIGCII